MSDLESKAFFLLPWRASNNIAKNFRGPSLIFFFLCLALLSFTITASGQTAERTATGRFVAVSTASASPDLEALPDAPQPVGSGASAAAQENAPPPAKAGNQALRRHPSSQSASLALCRTIAQSARAQSEPGQLRKGHSKSQLTIALTTPPLSLPD